ncbi:MFS transporter [Candidatus Poribacteria bacterium]|nr:MFS transporter [Candidatus Poribacteria bacterium]
MVAGEKRPASYRWLIFWILALGYVLVYFHRLSPGVMALELMKSFNAGGAIVGLLASAYFYPYALMQLPAGLLSDSLGPRKSVTMFLLVAAAGAILFGAAPSLGVAIFARVLVGLGVCMVFVPALKILSQWFTRGEFSMMTAILNAMGGVGVLVAASPLAFLTDILGWRKTFFAIGLATILLAGAVWRWVRNRPEDVGLPPIAPPGPGSQGASAAQPIPLLDGMKRVLKDRYFWAIAIWFFFNCGIFFGIGGLWGGPYLMHVYGLSKTGAGWVLNSVALGLIIGSPFLSMLSDKILVSRKKALILSSVAVAATMLLLAIFTDRLPHAALYVVFFSIGFFSAAIVVIAFTATKELFPLEIAGTSVGTVNLFPFAGGATFQPLLGVILQKVSGTTGVYTVAAYRAAFICCFIAALIALISISFMKETLCEVPKVPKVK